MAYFKCHHCKLWSKNVFHHQLCSDPCCSIEELYVFPPHLFAIVRDRWKDGAESLEAHGNVQQMGGKEEVVVVTQDGHGGVPN